MRLVDLFETWSKWRGKKTRARYLAVRVACLLDAYVRGCCEAVRDDGTYLGQADPEGRETQVPDPQFPSLSDDVDLKTLPLPLVYRILNFPNKVETARSAIESAQENDFHPDWDETFEERQYQYAILGIEAAGIAAELRTKFRISERDSVSFGLAEEMKSRRAEIDQRRATPNALSAWIAEKIRPIENAE